MFFFAVHTELGGTGIRLAYLFLGRVESKEHIVFGNLTQILVKFLDKLYFLGHAPNFVGCDKDKPEINATQKVWP